MEFPKVIGTVLLLLVTYIFDVIVDEGTIILAYEVAAPVELCHIFAYVLLIVVKNETVLPALVPLIKL